MTWAKHLNVTALNTLLEAMTLHSGLIFWIRTLDYQTQLYVSPNYQQVWGMGCEALYQNPAGWMDTLVAEDRDRLNQDFAKRAQLVAAGAAQTYHDTLLFRAIKQNKSREVIPIRDKAFALFDKAQCPVAIAGLGMRLTLEQWSYAIAGNVLEIEAVEKGFVHLLNEILNLTPQPLTKLYADNATKTNTVVYFQNQAYTLSMREAECLYHSVKGYSAKQIGKLLQLSPRTIETYLEHIKLKLNCRNKLQLLANVDVGELSFVPQEE